MERFTLWWLDGKREVISGETIAAAMGNAGYGQGALRALDFYSSGDSNDYVWDPDEREWTPRPGSKFYQELQEAAAKHGTR